MDFFVLDEGSERETSLVETRTIRRVDHVHEPVALGHIVSPYVPHASTSAEVVQRDTATLVLDIVRLVANRWLNIRQIFICKKIRLEKSAIFGVFIFLFFMFLVWFYLLLKLLPPSICPNRRDQPRWWSNYCFCLFIIKIKV